MSMMDLEAPLEADVDLDGLVCGSLVSMSSMEVVVVDEDEPVPAELKSDKSTNVW